MNIATVRVKLRKGRVGLFRMLKPGELIEAHDIVVCDQHYDFVSEQNVGQLADKLDTIIRLEFQK